MIKPEDFMWGELKKEIDAEEWERNDDGDNIKRIFLGTVTGLTPSGRVYSIYARGNVTDDQIEEDNVWWQQMDLLAASIGCQIEIGEDDGNDIFLIKISKMFVKLLSEFGYEFALQGLSLSYNQPESRMQRVADRICSHDNGENKFLESIVVWLDVVAPRYFWQQFDTYRTGVTKQSESTMHTILKKEINQDMFVENIDEALISLLEKYRVAKEFGKLKEHLPESFLQRRIICTNYKTLRSIYHQRKSHKLKEWTFFIDEILNQLKYAHFIKE